METKTFPGGVTQQQIDKWTADYGAPNEFFKVGLIPSFRDPNKKLAFYFKKPDKHVVARSTSHMMSATPDMPAAKQVMVIDCKIWAEAELESDELYKDQYMMAMGTLIGESFNVPVAELAKI